MQTKMLTATVVSTEAPGGAGPGECGAIASPPCFAWQGGVWQSAGWRRLPAEIPIHVDHRFTDLHALVARAAPYAEDGVLKVKGRYASTPDAQMVRTLVSEGMVTTMSIGAINAVFDDVDGVPHCKSAELLEASFVSVPSNTDALVTMAKAAANAGSAELHQALHDLAVTHGADCAHKAATAAPEGHTIEPGANAAPVATAENSTADEIPAAGAAKAAPAASGHVVAMAKARADMAEAELLLLTT